MFLGLFVYFTISERNILICLDTWKRFILGYYAGYPNAYVPYPKGLFWGIFWGLILCIVVSLCFSSFWNYSESCIAKEAFLKNVLFCSKSFCDHFEVCLSILESYFTCFLVKFCTDVLRITLKVIVLYQEKSFSTSPSAGYIMQCVGLFWVYS